MIIRKPSAGWAWLVSWFASFGLLALYGLGDLDGGSPVLQTGVVILVAIFAVAKFTEAVRGLMERRR